MPGPIGPIGPVLKVAVVMGALDVVTKPVGDILMAATMLGLPLMKLGEPFLK